ncbi:hypothetical protein [Thiohalocapsa sp. ML1]|uniref:hypothetical protein n=1 Tax=Thiohalocapsa sp. ML1 TaxID=1431688 RepID=UPI0007321925|nr:hypothetical protein [Thiohalocapsa sp. ML1]
MIDAFERHCLAHLQARLAALHAQAPMFLTPRTAPGAADPADIDDLADTESALLLRLEELTLLPESVQVGRAPTDAAQEWHARARVSLTLAGPAAGGEHADGVGGLVVSPAAERFAAVDHALAALLLDFRDRAEPAADGASSDAGAGLRGRLRAQVAGRSAELAWAWLELGPVRAERSGGRRLWRLAAAVRLHYRLSPAAPEGGRVLRVDSLVEGRGLRPSAGSLHAGAEALSLDAVDGLDTALRTELAGRGIGHVGDLPAPEHIGALLDDLAELTPAARAVLEQLATIAVVRRRFRPWAEMAPLPQPLLALPVLALSVPTPEQREILDAAEANLETRLHIALAARPLAALLRAPLQRELQLGHLLRVQAWQAAP